MDFLKAQSIKGKPFKRNSNIILVFTLVSSIFIYKKKFWEKTSKPPFVYQFYWIFSEPWWGNTQYTIQQQTLFLHINMCNSSNNHCVLVTTTCDPQLYRAGRWCLYSYLRNRKHGERGKTGKGGKNLTMSKQDFLQDQVFACDCNAILNYCQKLVLDFW